MLKKLRIQNYTLIDNLEVEFMDGFQVLTGETGAGKSVIIGAIGLLCGQRGQSDVVRSGCQKAVLEAEFDVTKSNLDEIYKSNSIDPMGNYLIIRREINQSGISRAFINDTPASIGTLSSLTSILIDLHGQHQHQKLLHVENHCEYLDSFASLNEEVEQYIIYHKSFLECEKELDQLNDKKRNSVNQHDLYSFQIAELEKANLDKDELSSLKSERTKLENSEKLFEVAESVSGILYSSENSILFTVSQLLSKLKDVQNIDKDYQELASNLESAQLLIDEVGRSAEFLKNKIEFNPPRLEEIRNRENEINWLFKKYHVDSVEKLIEYKKNIESELNNIKNYDHKINQLKSQKEKIQKDLSELALSISLKRKNQIDLLDKRMMNILESLGMKNAQFKTILAWQERMDGIIKIDNKTYKSLDRGIDEIEFMVSLNKGEPLKPLQKIASGGEISRIMLAIKSALSDVEDTSTLIFDEIDNGISGKIAQIVGNKFYELGKSKQLIVITHLPQIASQADIHFSVGKKEFDGRTLINLKKLDKNQRIIEIAKLLGGEKISDEALANAKNLLNISNSN